MSTYEKIATVIIFLLVVGILAFSFREFREPPEHGGEMQERSTFDESFGQNFTIGPFATLVSTTSSGGLEENCGPFQPVIIGTLHDIKEHLEAEKIPAFEGKEGDLMVNQSALDLFCNKSAEAVLADQNGDKLLLQKIPFDRGVPPGGMQDDIGVRVHIAATLIVSGEATSSKPTTFGEEFIPDRYLEGSPSSL